MRCILQSDFSQPTLEQNPNAKAKVNFFNKSDAISGSFAPVLDFKCWKDPQSVQKIIWMQGDADLQGLSYWDSDGAAVRWLTVSCFWLSIEKSFYERYLSALVSMPK